MQSGLPARPRKVLPDRFGVVSEVLLFGQRWLISARDHLLWIALFNTIYMLLAVPVGMALALGVAIVLNQQLRGRQMLRAIFYLPNVLPIAATSVIWLWIFNPEFGILNHLLGSVGLPSNGRWLSDESSVKPSLMIMGIWSALGLSDAHLPGGPAGRAAPALRGGRNRRRRSLGAASASSPGPASAPPLSSCWSPA